MDNSLLKFLEELDTEMARQMLKDLRTEERRTPQLYNAINKLLDRHKFHIAKLEPEADVLGNLSTTLNEYLNMKPEDFN